jgi:hypothetical protein
MVTRYPLNTAFEDMQFYFHSAQQPVSENLGFLELWVTHTSTHSSCLTWLWIFPERTQLKRAKLCPCTRLCTHVKEFTTFFSVFHTHPCLPKEISDVSNDIESIKAMKRDIIYNSVKWYTPLSQPSDLIHKFKKNCIPHGYKGMPVRWVEVKVHTFLA